MSEKLGKETAVTSFLARLFGSEVDAQDYNSLLKWLILTGVAVFGLFATWHFGLLQLMLRSDRSFISLVILLIYALFSFHCFYQILYISRETNAAQRIKDLIAHRNDSFTLVGDRVVLSDGSALAPGVVTEHIRNLIVKARKQGDMHLDQTLLLGNLADMLRARQSVGWFVADALLKLGLLGTVIGFILMLSPIATIDSFDVETMKGALSTMSGGMAVALFTTLAGLIGGTLLKLQYYLLDEGTSQLFALTTEMTEVHVISVLDRMHGKV